MTNQLITHRLLIDYSLMSSMSSFNYIYLANIVRPIFLKQNFPCVPLFPSCFFFRFWCSLYRLKYQKHRLFSRVHSFIFLLFPCSRLLLYVHSITIHLLQLKSRIDFKDRRNPRGVENCTNPGEGVLSEPLPHHSLFCGQS